MTLRQGHAGIAGTDDDGLVAAAGLAVLVGLYDQVSTVSALAACPVFVWEMSLAGYLLVKGFTPPPLAAGTVPPVARPAALSPA